MNLQTSSNFKMVHWNCFSLKNKIRDLDLFLKKSKPDIVSLNEIKMSAENANFHLRFEGYSTHFKSRLKGGDAGGGVALLIREPIKFETSNIFDKLDLEVVAVKLSVEGKNIFVVSYYNPGKLEAKLFKTLDEQCNNYILLGDLNAHAEILGSRILNQSGKILDDIILNGRHVLLNDVSLPTYVGFNQDKQSVLDLCICSSSMGSKVSDFDVLYNSYIYGSDHLPLQVLFSFINVEKFLNNTANNGIIDFNYDKADWPAFKRELGLKAPFVPLTENVDILNSFLVESITESAAKTIPLITYSVRANIRQPYPKFIIEIKKERNKAKRKVENSRFMVNNNISDLRKIFNALTKNSN